MQKALTLRQKPKAGVRWTPLSIALAILLIVMVFATGIGSVQLSPSEVLQAISNGLSNTLSGSSDTIIWKIRLPRVLMAAFVGASLALSGVAYQGIFRNPLADPYLLGVASGASLGAALAIVLGASIPFFATLGVPVFAFLFSLFAVFLVIALAKQGRSIPTVSLILAGAVLGSSFTAATSFLMLFSREQAATVLAWLLGSFGLSSWAKLASVAPFMLLSAIIIFLSSRALNLMQLGEDQAAQLGLPVETFKYSLITIATLATSAAVSVSGIIGFVGLMVPHAARLAFGPDHRTLVPMSAVLGAIFMVLADLLARSLISPAEIPIGVVTALVGGPFFLYLLKRQNKGRL